MEEDREQPFEEPAHVSGETIENRAVSEDGSLTPAGEENLEENADKEESPASSDQDLGLGKFKSVQALLDAYNSLQTSFTKKCQRLSELEKEKTQYQIESIKEDEIEEKIGEFLLKNEEAKNYAEEIKDEVLSQGFQGSNAIQNAWNNVVIKHVKKRENLASDELVDKYVLTDENVRNKIIQDYLNSLKNSQAPIVMSSGQGQRVAEAIPSTPQTLSDAKRALERMFN